ncbi:MAG TPA: universal stress protein [Vicinamibacterales bacterium]
MIATHILVGHDGSRDAETAFEDALDLAALARARLTVVSVASPPEPPTEVEAQAAIDVATTHDEKLFESLRRQAQERNVKMETHVLVGHPADQILKSGQKYGADPIVVGRRGRSAIREWVSGSTSRRVVSHANCPVLVVRAR